MTATSWSLQAHWDAPWEGKRDSEWEKTEREARFEELLSDLLPEIQRRHPQYTDERILETAIHLAAFRLKSEAENGSADRPDKGAGGRVSSGSAS